MTDSRGQDRSWMDEAFRSFDYGEFCKRLRNARQSEELLWDELCRRAKLPPVGAKSAVRDCERDFRPHIEILERLAAPLGLTAEWLVTGRSRDNEIVVSVRAHTQGLIKAFIEKQEVSEDDAVRLHQYANRKFRNLYTQTPQAVYRCGIPQTLREVGYLYEEMKAMEG